MSNILKIIQFLKGNENRFITITNQENGKLIGKKDTYLTDIPNEDLVPYLKFQLGDIVRPTLVWIELRSKQGTTSKKEDVAKIEVMPANYQEPATQLPVVQNYNPAVVHEQAPQPSFLGMPGNNVFGLGLPEIMNMQRNSDRLEDKKEQLAELKEEYKELKQRYNILEIENRESLSKLAISESQKDMAVMLAKNENKSFADSPVFQSLIERAPELLNGIAAMKGQPVPGPNGLGSPAAASATHTEFFEYANDHLTEGQMNYLGSICNYMGNPEFVNELKELITRYAAI